MGERDQQIELQNRVCKHTYKNPSIDTKFYPNVLDKYSLTLCLSCSTDPIFSEVLK